MSLADEKIDTGCEIIPSPFDLFTIEEDVSEPVTLSSSSSTEEEPSTVSTNSRPRGDSYVGVSIYENMEIYKLPRTPKLCHKGIK